VTGESREYLFGGDTPNLSAMLVNHTNPLVLRKQGERILAAGEQGHDGIEVRECSSLHDGLNPYCSGLVDLAHELLDVIVGRLQHDILGAANLLHRSVAKDGDTITDLQGFVEVMRYEEDGLLQRALKRHELILHS
jgi:hypothetical protein